MITLCRRCGKRPAVTSDGFCFRCKKKDTMKQKIGVFGRRLDNTNRLLSGGIVD